MAKKKGGRKEKVHKGAAKKKKAVAEPTAEELEQRAEMKDAEGVPKWLSDGLTTADKDVLIHNIRLTSPGGRKVLINGCRLSLVEGRHYGLFGRNGIGKSCLLKAIAGYQFEEMPQSLRVVMVGQESDHGSHLPPLEVVQKSDEQKAYLDAMEEKLLNKLESADEDMDLDVVNEKLEAVYRRLEDIGARQSEGRAFKILEGLQFTKEMMEKPTSSLSGGWRMRVALACALYVTPDILLLDEPTNHLDFPAVVWLETYLKDYPSTLVVVSHDRMFLDNIITDVMDFRNESISYYRGDYTSYEKVRGEELRAQKKLYEAQQKKIDNLKAFIHDNSFIGNEKTAAACKQKKRDLDKIMTTDLVPEPIEEKKVKIKFPVPDALDHKLVSIIDMDYSWDPDPDAPLLIRDVNLSFDVEDRVGMLGANGCGKSTLLKLILGEIQPKNGTCKLNPQARVATFTQHHMDQLNPEVTPFEFLCEKFPLAKQGTVRGFLCSFGLDIKCVTEQKIKTLSGGQKSRVAFAVLNWQKPHFIVMDEPTNHLDLETIDGLLGALESFTGGILVVSHDQYFLSKLANAFWSVNSRGEVELIHDFEDAKAFSYKFNVVTADIAKPKEKKLTKSEKKAIEDDAAKYVHVEDEVKEVKYVKAAAPVEDDYSDEEPALRALTSDEEEEEEDKRKARIKALKAKAKKDEAAKAAPKAEESEEEEDDETRKARIKALKAQPKKGKEAKGGKEKGGKKEKAPKKEKGGKKKRGD